LEVALPRGHAALAFVDAGVGFVDRAVDVVAVGFHRIPEEKLEGAASPGGIKNRHYH
jgi:hypothetical protein